MIPSIDGTVRSQTVGEHRSRHSAQSDIGNIERVMNGRAYKVVTAQDGIKEISQQIPSRIRRF